MKRKILKLAFTVTMLLTFLFALTLSVNADGTEGGDSATESEINAANEISYDAANSESKPQVTINLDFSNGNNAIISALPNYNENATVKVDIYRITSTNAATGIISAQYCENGTLKAKTDYSNNTSVIQLTDKFGGIVLNGTNISTTEDVTKIYSASDFFNSNGDTVDLCLAFVFTVTDLGSSQVDSVLVRTATFDMDMTGTQNALDKDTFTLSEDNTIEHTQSGGEAQQTYDTYRFTVIKDDSETWSPIQRCAIGERYYSSVTNAIAGMSEKTSDDKTIYLCLDTKENVTISSDTSINLGGHTITPANDGDYGITVGAGKTLTLSNNSTTVGKVGGKGVDVSAKDDTSKAKLKVSGLLEFEVLISSDNISGATELTQETRIGVTSTDTTSDSVLICSDVHTEYYECFFYAAVSKEYLVDAKSDEGLYLCKTENENKNIIFMVPDGSDYVRVYFDSKNNLTSTETATNYGTTPGVTQYIPNNNTTSAGRFIGWYSGKNGSGTLVTSINETALDALIGEHDNVVLYAQFDSSTSSAEITAVDPVYGDAKGGGTVLGFGATVEVTSGQCVSSGFFIYNTKTVAASTKRAQITSNGTVGNIATYVTGANSGYYAVAYVQVRETIEEVEHIVTYYSAVIDGSDPTEVQVTDSTLYDSVQIDVTK